MTLTKTIKKQIAKMSWPVENIKIVVLQVQKY